MVDTLDSEGSGICLQWFTQLYEIQVAQSCKFNLDDRKNNMRGGGGGDKPKINNFL